MTINIIEKKRKMMGWCPYSSAKIIKKIQLERIDGSLIFTLFNPSHIPETAEQWMGFLTAISAVVGVVAGLTAKSNHSIGRKMIHLLFAIPGVVMTFNMLARQPLFAGWL